MKSTLKSKRRRPMKSTRKARLNTEIKKEEADEINKKSEAEIKKEEEAEHQAAVVSLYAAEIKKEETEHQGRSVYAYEVEKEYGGREAAIRRSFADKRVYLHGVKDGWDYFIEAIQSRYPHSLLVVGCYNDEEHKKMFKVKTPRMTYEQRLESLNNCKLVHSVIPNAPMEFDEEDFMSKHNLDLVVGYNPVPKGPVRWMHVNTNIIMSSNQRHRLLATRVYDTNDYDFEDIKKRMPNADIVVGILSDEDACQFLGKRAKNFEERFYALKTSKSVDLVIAAPWYYDQDFLDSHRITCYLKIE